MVIKKSSRQQVGELLADLSADSQSIRDAAIARLTLIGARAVGRLIAAAGDAEMRVEARAAALTALEGIADARALEVAARSLQDPDAAVAGAAVGVLRVFLPGSHGGRAVEALTSVAVDRRRPDAIRLAAVGAMRDLEAATLKPLLTLLQDDPSEAVRGATRGGPSAAAGADDEARLSAAAAGGALDDPEAIRQSIVKAGGKAPLSTLAALIERLREREAAEPAGRRVQWVVARAAAHNALAHRGSRIALYDLRETLEAASEPVPVEFLTVLSEVGEASCLEAIAGAYARAMKKGVAREDWWRRHLCEAFRVIVARERLTRRHALVKKLDKRWKDALGELWAERPRRRGEAAISGRR